MRTLLTTLFALALALTAPFAHAVSGGGEAAGPAGPAYATLGEAMVVNVYENGTLHFLSIEPVVLVPNAAAAKRIEEFVTPIRHELLMLYSAQAYEELFKLETKQRLLADSLTLVQEVLKKELGDPLAEAVFFNSFIIQ